MFAAVQLVSKNGFHSRTRSRFSVLTAGISAAFSLLLASTSADGALIGYWTMDDNASNSTVLDSSGNSRHGTLHDTSNNSRNTDLTHITGGKVGSTFEFGAAYTQWIDVSAHISAFGGLSSFSSSLWFKNNNQTIHAFDWGGAPNTDHDYNFNLYNRFELFDAGHSSTASGINGSTQNNANWQLLVVTVQDPGAPSGNSTVRYHVVDGSGFVLQGQFTNKRSPIDNPPWTSFGVGGGYAHNGANHSSRGQLDDAAMWNRVLTDGQILSLYHFADNATLNYGAFTVDKLFDVYDGALSSYTVGGLTWTYAAGLSQSLGHVVQIGDSFFVQLDQSGFGVMATAIPEPSTLILVLLGMVSCAAVARGRNRKAASANVA